MLEKRMLEEYLKPTYFIDWDHKRIQDFIGKAALTNGDPLQKALRAYALVRDSFRYNPYKISIEKIDLKASAVIERGYGYCVTKALLLVAVWRALGIPARPGYADVRNHLSSPRLTRAMGTDIFYYHGYAEAYLEGKWVKATPAFDARLCKRAGISPLEFNGKEDSIFHPYNQEGQKYMEYLHDHGSFADLPYDQMIACYKANYPDVGIFQRGLQGSFEKEARAGGT